MEEEALRQLIEKDRALDACKLHLKAALIALNAAPRYEIPALGMDSYVLASKFSDYLK